MPGLSAIVGIGGRRAEATHIGEVIKASAAVSPGPRRKVAERHHDTAVTEFEEGEQRSGVSLPRQDRRIPRAAPVTRTYVPNVEADLVEWLLVADPVRVVACEDLQLAASIEKGVL